MNKVTIIGIVVVLVVVLAVAWSLSKSPSDVQQEETLTNSPENIESSVPETFTIPTVDPNVNAVGEAPDVNPFSYTNPFKNVKTNPFE